MKNFELGYWRCCCEGGCHYYLICNNITWDEVQENVFKIEASRHTKGKRKAYPAKWSDLIDPTWHRLSKTTVDHSWPVDNKSKISSVSFQVSLRQVLRISIGVWIAIYQLLCILSNCLMIHLQNIFKLYFKVFFMSFFLNVLLDCREVC